MKAWDRVAIVGVGLIGGSIGIDLLRRGLARHVVGVGHRPASLRAAKRVGAVSTTTTDLARGVADAELTIVCTPVSRIAADCLAAAGRMSPGGFLTDAGSTKASIVANVERGDLGGVHFVGSHPLAGSEKSGPNAAVADLFQQRTVVITPTDHTPAAAIETISRLWRGLGARIVTMAPDEHDGALAATSHLPHLLSAALAATTPAEHAALVARGWLDTTRIAAGDPALWTAILLDNRQHVGTALKRLETRLAAVRQALRTRDSQAIEHFLTEAKERRDALGS